MQRIFLDTTIQIRRLIYAPPIRQAIQKQLQGSEILTSTYVWMEAQRTIGQDFQYLIDLVLRKQPATVSQLLYDLGEQETIFSSRTLGRVVQLTAQLLDEFQPETFHPIDIAIFLQQHREWMLHHAFFAGIDQVLDTTQCDLVRPNYTVTPGGRMSCRRTTARCALPSLLNTHAQSLQQLQANSPLLAGLGTTTQRALTAINVDFGAAKGERNCWSLGDLIIVLECPPDALLWTTNLRHFEPLCQVLGRQLFRPEQG
jgi:hypothetical protein